MEEFTAVELCRSIRRIMINRSAECMTYATWSDEFIAKEIREIPKIVKEWKEYHPIDPNELTRDEMIELGFGKWSDEDPMYLIPLWLLPFLPDEIECGCIDGEKSLMKIAEMDNDNRFGCLAYGVMPKE